jgi:hypothetical protein
MTEEDAGDRLDDAFAGLIPRGSASGRLLDVLKLAGELAGLGTIIKLAAFTGGWWPDDRKADRVFPVLLALKDKLHDADKIRDAYIRKDEFKDLFEETIRRIADEPDPDRREWFENILLNVIERSRGHSENRLFLRLVDELSTAAHKILGSLDTPFTREERQLDRDNILAQRAGLDAGQVVDVLEELISARLIKRDRLEGPDPATRTIAPSLAEVSARPEQGATYGVQNFSYFLSRLGQEFLSYRRGM